MKIACQQDLELYYDHTIWKWEKLLAAFVHIRPKLKTVKENKPKSFITLWAAS
jgi:hypothetical protein